MNIESLGEFAGQISFICPCEKVISASKPKLYEEIWTHIKNSCPRYEEAETQFEIFKLMDEIRDLEDPNMEQNVRFMLQHFGQQEIPQKVEQSRIVQENGVYYEETPGNPDN
jgi:hypothetical protein